MNRQALAISSFPHRLAGDRSRLGLTLFEMLIVVAIIATVSALVLPMMGETTGARLRAGANLLIADLGLAQSRSIAAGDDPIVVVVREAGDGYHLARQSDPTQPIVDPTVGGDHVVRLGFGRARFTGDMTMAVEGADVARTVGFSRFGALDQPGAARFVLRADGRQITVTVDPETGDAAAGVIAPIPD